MTTIYKSKRIEICTYSKDSHSIVLGSGDDHYPGCTLKMTGFGYWVSIRLPAIIKPVRWKVKAHTWDAATIERIGRDWYWDYDSREYGIGIHSGNHFNLYYGRQSDDSRLEKRWSCFLPWTEIKLVRSSGYGLDGEWLVDFDQKNWEQKFAQRDALPRAKFLFADYDGQIITASCYIEEAEYSKGVGYFRWLRYFVKNKVFRSMRMDFSAEVGREKGSWKGGVVGSGIDVQAGELHEAAFKRYCEKQNLRFLGRAEDVQAVA